MIDLTAINPETDTILLEHYTQAKIEHDERYKEHTKNILVGYWRQRLLKQHTATIGSYQQLKELDKLNQLGFRVVAEEAKELMVGARAHKYVNDNETTTDYYVGGIVILTSVRKKYGIITYTAYGKNTWGMGTTKESVLYHKVFKRGDVYYGCLADGTIRCKILCVVDGYRIFKVTPRII